MKSLEILDISKEYNIHLSNNEEKHFIIFNSNLNIDKFKLHIDLDNFVNLSIYNVVTTTNKFLIDELININGSNSHVEIINVLLVKNCSLDSNIIINHNYNNSSSAFSTYCIALSDTFVTLNNNAYIKKGCSKSIVHQKAKGLTLDKTSIIKAQPNLYIDEYDVQASHAASIGSINKDDLFYLTSRGLTIEESSKLIVMGFIKPVLDEIDNDDLKNNIFDHFTKLL